MLENTTLADIIQRDTNTPSIQADVFVSTERHSGTSGGVDPTGADAAPGQAQLVIGSKGNDTLSGGSLSDTLVAAPGHMTMTGGAGDDTFVFNKDQPSSWSSRQRHQDHGANLNTATITDFAPDQDKLQIDATIRQIHLSSDHHGGTLVYAGNEQIDLLGVQQGELSIHRDFILRSGAPANGTGNNSDSTIALLGQHIAADSPVPGPSQSGSFAGGPLSAQTDPAPAMLVNPHGLS